MGEVLQGGVSGEGASGEEEGEVMTVTGKQLFEMWREEADGPSWERLSALEQVPWDALAQKLNIKSELAARARHHATCPYRHGTGDCTC